MKKANHVFNAAEAHRYVNNLTDVLAVKWARIANAEFSRLKALKLPLSSAFQNAIRNASITLIKETKNVIS